MLNHNFRKEPRAGVFIYANVIEKTPPADLTQHHPLASFTGWPVAE